MVRLLLTHWNRAISHRKVLFTSLSKNIMADAVRYNCPRQQSSWGQHGADLGPVGTRWTPCWPHVPYYQGCVMADILGLKLVFASPQLPPGVRFSTLPWGIIWAEHDRVIAETHPYSDCNRKKHLITAILGEFLTGMLVFGHKRISASFILSFRTRSWLHLAVSRLCLHFKGIG